MKPELIKVIELPIKQVKIGKRYREDLGTKESLELMAQTIRDKGVLHPIIVDAHYQLISGRRRIEASKIAGVKTIPVRIRASKTELDKREVELIEDVARKDLDYRERAHLQKRIYELKKAQDPNWSRRQQAMMQDTSKASIVRQIEIADALDMFPQLADCKTEDQAYKVLKKLQEHAVINEMAKRVKGKGMELAKWAEDHYKIQDAIEGMRQVKDGKADFVEVDPPYSIDINARKSRSGLSALEKYDEIDPDKYPKFIGMVAKEVYRLMKPNAFCIWWHAPQWYQPIIDILRNLEFSVSDIPAIWTKGGMGQTASPDSTLGSCYEQFFVCRRGKPKLRKPGRANIFDFTSYSGARKIHRTEKPLELYLEILNTFCFPGNCILSPFLGSANILRAAYKQDLVGWGYGLDSIVKKNFIARVKADIAMQEEPEPEGVKVDD
ncbi:MAG: ParB N-terminal domain-containing protein [Nitrospira sp.]|nr:ParB N-terminal domain-containing protein [Nitrospira sp.]